MICLIIFCIYFDVITFVSFSFATFVFVPIYVSVFISVRAHGMIILRTVASIDLYNTLSQVFKSPSHPMLRTG